MRSSEAHEWTGLDRSFEMESRIMRNWKRVLPMWIFVAVLFGVAAGMAYAANCGTECNGIIVTCPCLDVPCTVDCTQLMPSCGCGCD